MVEMDAVRSKVKLVAGLGNRGDVWACHQTIWTTTRPADIEETGS